MVKEKKLHLEVLRILAIFLVILNHTGKRGFISFTKFSPSLKYFLLMCIPVACSICVPIFYMVSGATLLHKEETPGKIWKKRIPRFGAVLVLASFLMYHYNAVQTGTPMEFGEFWRKLYSTDMIIPYWYLYSYLGFLIALPFFRRVVRGMTDREFRYLMLVHLLFAGVLPMVQYRLSGGSLWLNSSLNVALITDTIFIYPAMGYYFENRPVPGWKRIGLLWAVSVLTLLATLTMTHYKIQLTGELAENKVGTFFKSLRMIPTVTVYVTVKKAMASVHLPKWGEKMVVSLGSCTFGIYLIEQILRKETYWLRDALARWMPDIGATLLQVVWVMVLGWGIVWVLKRLPVLRKLL